MKIIYRKNLFAEEILKKIAELVDRKLSFEDIEDLSEFSDTVVVALFSFDIDYDVNNINSKAIAQEIEKWIDYATKMAEYIKSQNIPTLYVVLNCPYDNCLNRAGSEVVENIFEQIKDVSSINFVYTNLHLMENANYARIRFNYTERFDKPNIDIIRKMCNLLCLESMDNHCGYVFRSCVYDKESRL